VDVPVSLAKGLLEFEKTKPSSDGILFASDNCTCLNGMFTGLSLLKKMTGQTCRACHRFFINVEDAKTHCRTLMHYNNFVELVKEKVSGGGWARNSQMPNRNSVMNSEKSLRYLLVVHFVPHASDLHTELDVHYCFISYKYFL
jgi:hypothetical protein